MLQDEKKKCFRPVLRYRDIRVYFFHGFSQYAYLVGFALNSNVCMKMILQ